MPEPAGPPPAAPTWTPRPGDGGRRTLLANERTYLAWWRTGLTAFAVALGAARVVPALTDPGHRWPYTALGVLFAGLGVVAVVAAERRHRAVEAAVREGTFAPAAPALLSTLTALAALAGVAMAVLFVLDA